MPDNRSLRLILLAFGFVLGAIGLFSPIGSMFYFHRYLGDYTVFWGIGSAPLDLVYTRYGFAYPPPALFLVRPFGLFPFWPSLIMWSVAGIAAMTLALCRSVPLPIIGVGFLTYSAVGVVAGGQTSLFVGALIIAGLSSKQIGWRGAFLAAATVIKPQSLLAAPIALIAAREWRTIGVAIAAGVAIMLGSALVFGPGKWVDWFTHLFSFPHYLTSRGIDITDVGVYGLVRRLGLPGWTYVAGIPVGIVSAFLVFRSEAPPLDRYIAFACATVLMSPYTLGYDLAGLSIACVAILFDRRRPVPMWIAASLIISSFFTAIGIVLMSASLAHAALERGRE